MNPEDFSPRKIRVLLAVKILAWVQYGGVFFTCFFGPVIYQKMGGSSIGAGYYYILVVATVFFAAFAGIGLSVMRYLLRSIQDQIVVEIWSLAALLMAPFTAAIYIYLSTKMPLKNPDLVGVRYLLSPFIGFYLPFLLLVFWIKYRYRQDEF